MTLELRSRPNKASNIPNKQTNKQKKDDGGKEDTINYEEDKTRCR
jgi:flagellar biosynthesis/type III secretory pathway M-ring protein FliF/YscJ